MIVFADLETFCAVPIKHGSYRYAEDAEVLLSAWAVEDGPVQVAEGMPQDFLGALDSATEIVIHNSMFDRTILREQGYNIPVDKITDTMILAYLHGLPGSLDQLCYIFGVPVDKAKDKDGKRLVHLFTKPRPKNSKLRRATKETHPDDWAAFVEYARRDVDAMRHLHGVLPDWNDSDGERSLWWLDQRINDRGIAIDLDLAHAALRAFHRTSGTLAAAAAAITNGAVTPTTRRAALLDYLGAEHGIDLPDARKGTIEAFLAGNADLPPGAVKLLENRLQASATSPAKYRTLLDATNRDGRLRGTVQFGGASRTLRDAGRLFQPQNLPRQSLPSRVIEHGIKAMKLDCEDLLFGNVSELCVNAVRGCIVAGEGNKLVVADLSNIEGRVLAWLADEHWKLDAFRAFDRGEGHDLYVLTYARSFGLGVETVLENKKSGDGSMRQVGKVMELAFGFGGAVGAFRTMGANCGVDLPEDKIVDTVKAWRAAHPAIRNFWYALENAAIAAVERPGNTYTAGPILFDLTTDAHGREWLRAKLPKGRYLTYAAPKVAVESCERCDGAGRVLFNGKDMPCVVCGGNGGSGRKSLSYEGINQYTRKWERLPTYGGKLAENMTQAVARDVFMDGMREAEAQGYPVVMRVHDELVAETPDDPAFNAGKLAAIMAKNALWNVGLPLAAAGFECHRYRKD